MKTIIKPFIILTLWICFLSVLNAQEVDVRGSEDHPVVTRMSEFYIGDYEKNEFENVTFKTAEGTVELEGQVYEIDYRLKSGKTARGKAQILANYKNALTEIGAEIMLEGSYYHVYRLRKGGMETWIKVDPGNYDGKRYELTILERKVLEQEVVANAEAMKNGILNHGHIALYGIHFDSGKALVKPDSEKAIEEIANFLKENPDINLYIVGHTDSDGDLYSNMELSLKRADAVLTHLVEKFGIERTRLDPKGLGPLAPVASNRSPEGKAKNRRVELVENID